MGAISNVAAMTNGPSFFRGMEQFAEMFYPSKGLAEKLAVKKIYHPEEFDKEIKDVEAGRHPILQRNYGKFRPTHEGVVQMYNKAFKSKVYQDAMKNYELRQQFQDRYVPAGFESLQNLDMYAERGAALQRRGLLGRRRSQSLGGEQVPQEAGL